jgi:hypothetical protein
VLGAPPTEKDAKARIAEVLRRHIDDLFSGNLKRAAEDLGYERQRLQSYISETSFPGAEVFDKIREKWGLDLLNINGARQQPPTEPYRFSEQLSLFDYPVRLANGGVELTLERKGAAIAVGITISPDVRVA